jgi:hypothetical protein
VILRAKEAALVLIGFTALAVVTTYPLILKLTSELAGDAGDPVWSAWTLAWDAARIPHGLKGLWDAPTFFPYHNTLAYSDHLLGIAVFTAPVQWLTNNPVFTYNVAFLAAFVTSAAGMYVLARSLTGRRDAAWIAALLYVVTPFRAAHIAHVHWLTTGWLPLGVWALNRYFDTRRWRFLATAAACYLMQALTASYFAYFALVPLAIVGAAEMWRRRPPLARTVVHVGVVAVLVLAVLVPVGRAYYQVRREVGFRRSASDIVQLSADVRDYASAPPRTWLWRRLGTDQSEHALFPGAMTLALAAIGLAAARPRRAIAVYAAMALIAFVLSLGPQPALAGHRLPIPGPYGWLLAIVPGLDGLRAAARLATVVALALSVLAAFGAAWLLDRTRRRYRRVVFAAIVAAIVIEGWAAPMPTAAFDPRGYSLDRNVYEYLRESPPGAILELPIALEDSEREVRYQYLTLIHGHPIVNGHSGYVSPLLSFLGGGHSPFREVDNLGAAMAMLRGVGVRYLVLHTADDALEFPPGRFLDHRDQIEAVRTFRRAAVITLREAAPVAAGVPEGHPVESSALHVRASHSPERLALALDGDPETRWLSATRQSGDEWIDIEFDRPLDVSGIEMVLASRSFGDYPRRLAVDVVDETGRHTAFDDTVLPQFAAGLIKDGNYPGIEVRLAPNHARAVRLRQLGTTRSFFWSIHELRVWER